MKDNRNLELIKERLNILDVVSTYIKLEKAGSQFRARCPFHNEKSPSFYISPARGTYHCFGCSEHGDIFGFTMKIEGLQFKDALKMLADKAGVSLSNFRKEEVGNVLDILENTTIFFEENLKNNIDAQNYLKSRGLSTEIIKRFRVGFAQNDWRTLYTYLQKLNYSDEEILSSGVCIRHEKDNKVSLYDRFRSRVMFPIMNASGKVVAFTGRIIGMDEGRDEVAKYVNSPETETYHKSSILFGYDKAKMEIGKTKKVIVVEGQMDVVMTHMAGTQNVVAISGTAFTPEHISILKRFAEVVVLALDSDKAGYNAMLKSASLALQSDLEVEGIKMTNKDPADMVKTDPKMWDEAVKNSKPILTLIAEIIKEKESVRPKQIQLMRKDLFPLLRVVKSPLLKQAYLQEIAEILNVAPNIIQEEVDLIKSELEGQIKKEKKIVPKIDILTIVAKGKAASEILKIKLELDMEEIPDDILNKEHILLEKSLSEVKAGDEKEKERILREAIYLAKKVIYENAIMIAKNKIGEGVDMEENLKIIQEFSKKLKNI